MTLIELESVNVNPAQKIVSIVKATKSVKNVTLTSNNLSIIQTSIVTCARTQNATVTIQLAPLVMMGTILLHTKQLSTATQQQLQHV